MAKFGFTKPSRATSDSARRVCVNGCVEHSLTTRAVAFNARRRFAFTLAEVLITLGIIGVVAAMTIPTLIANYQKTQTVTKLKKAYAEIVQAFKQAEVDHGSGWNFADFDTMQERNTYFAENYLFPHIKIANVCVSSSSVCWADKVYSLSGVESSSLKNVAMCTSFVTISGYSVYFWLHENGKGGWFYIDINGNQKPNIIGKDIFAFVATWDEQHNYKLGFFPAGLHERAITPTRQQLKDGGFGSMYSQDANAGCKKGINSGYAGVYCSGLIVQDGWKISPDYPW